MDQARFLRVKELFQRALAWPAAERERLLTEACAEDGALRAEVLDLLRHAAAAGPGFLAGSAPVGAPAAPTLVIPGFRVLECLATGGSGTVYRAEQTSPRREVALKVLRLDSLAPGHVARFEREAAILAGLDHPGIARVIQAGVREDGALRVPWIAMEFVRGATLDEHVRDRRPGLVALLELFVGLCDAVEHAHAKGIVHRDLKPSNVMIDEAGRPRVLDFGVARTLQAPEAGAEGFTRTGMLIGTLAYMAPEQARGAREVDARADVYGLGAMLFEFLTGLAPVPTDELELVEAAQAVCNQEPTPLRRLRPDLSRDLETILAKALEKEPERRYASAGALGADLRRLLANRPVLARPATAIYQARKFVRRNRALSVATLAVVLALSAGLGVALVSLRKERQTTALLTDATSFVGDVMLDLAPRVGFGLEEQPSMEQALGLFERLRDGGTDTRELRGLRARLLYELAVLDQASASLPTMRARLEGARALREELAAADPRDLESRTHLSQIYAKLGEAEREAGDLAGRDAWFARALELDESLVRENPGDPELVEDLCWSLERLALAASEGGDLQRAAELHARHLALAEELETSTLERWKALYNLSHAHYFMAGIRIELGEAELAAQHAREAVRHARLLAEIEPDRRDFLEWLADTCMGAQDVLHNQLGDARAARPFAEEALQHAEALALGDPGRSQHLHQLQCTADATAYFAQGAGDLASVADVARRLRRALQRFPAQADATKVAELEALAARLETESGSGVQASSR